MPALATDIAAAMRAAAIDTQQSTTVKTRHPGARDTGPEPRLSYFDSMAHAAVLNAEAFALMSAERRLFAVATADMLSFAGGLDFSQKTPTVTLVDGEQASNNFFLVARIELDLEAETTGLTLFG